MSNMSNPLVSVILPTHNTGDFIYKTIDSILNQTYKEIELIVVDDCSTDNTWDSILEYADSDDRIIPIHLDKNRHVCNASNQGYRVAKGKYIALIGQDDYWDLDKIRKQVDVLELDAELSACFSFLRIVDKQGNISNQILAGISSEEIELFSTKEYIEKIFWKGNFLAAPSALVRKEFIDKAYGKKYLYKPSLLLHQDHFLWLEILKYGGFKIIEEPLLYYRYYGEEGKNLSYMTPEKHVRSNHECVIEEARYIEFMENNLFVEVFQNYFENMDARSAIALKYEKAMILYKKGNPFCIRLLYELMDDEDNWNELEDKYHFDLMKLYNVSAESFNFDEAYTTELYTAYDEQRKLICEYEEIVKKQMSIIEKLSSNA